MKKHMFLSGLLALALTVGLTACTRQNPEPTPSELPQPSATPAVTPTPEPTAAPAAPPVWSEQVFSRSFQAGDGTPVMDVTYTLPLIQNTDACPAGAAINDWYKSEGSSRLAEAEEEYELVVADYDVSKATGFPFTATTQSMSSTVSYEDEAVISVRREWSMTSGSPYPTVFRLSEQFSAVTGQKLGFVDFFSDADTVRDRVTDAFLKQEEIRSGGFTRDQVSVAFQLENFYLTDRGYTFWIQGNTFSALHTPVEVSLTYDELKDVRIDVNG